MAVPLDRGVWSAETTSAGAPAQAGAVVRSDYGARRVVASASRQSSTVLAAVREEELVIMHHELPGQAREAL